LKKPLDVNFGNGTARKCSPHRRELLLLMFIVDVNYDVRACWFPLRAVAFRGQRFSFLGSKNHFLRDLQLGLRLLAPSKSLVAFPAGVDSPPLQSTITKADSNFFQSINECDEVEMHKPSEGKTRRLLRESEDDETPQRAFFASEEAHRKPAESVMYFRSGSDSLLCSL